MRVISWLALGLWVVTVAGGGFMLYKGQAAPGEDGRTIIKLNKDEQTFVLGEMRGLLEAVQGVVLALDENDMKGVVSAVAGKGLEDLKGGTPMAIMVKVPQGFRQLGRAMHQGFSDIRAAAKNGDGRDKVLKMLGDQLGRCTACHASFQLPR